MFSFIKKISFLTIALFSTEYAAALEINSNNYETYIGDVDGDGDGDYYFKQKPWTLILHGDIATPLQLQGTKHFVVYNNAGLLSAPQSFTLADADLTTKINAGTLKLAVENSDIFEVDKTSSKRTVLIRGATGSTPALLITSYANLDFPVEADVKTYGINQYFGISDRNAQLQIADINGDGYKDILLTSNSAGEYAYLAQGSVTNHDRYFEVTPSISKPIVDSTHVGTTSAQFRIDESGAANYSVPITVADGVAGVKPQLSINYNSSGGNGIAGLGGSLAGINAISRCRQTLLQDGLGKAITWSADDRFCLNGQRLMLVDAGQSYGAVNSNYKTEIDSFVRITAVGGIAGNPDYFEVYAKDGSKTIFGGNSKSKLNGTLTMTWAQSRFEDSVGNRIDYEYDGDRTSGHRLIKILYGYPNPDSSTDHSASVVLDYVDRNDVMSGYFSGGGEVKSKKILKTIKTYNGSNLFRQYSLNYNEATYAADNINRLTSIQECTGANGTDCFSPTQFEWGFKVTGFSPSSIKMNQLPSTSKFKTYRFFDYNADGKQDFLWVYGSGKTRNIEYGSINKFATGAIEKKLFSGTYDKLTYTIPEDNDEAELIVEIIDYNNDGRQDIAICNPLNIWKIECSSWDLYLSTPDGKGGWYLSYNKISLPFINQAMLFGDANSDGLTDAIDLKASRIFFGKKAASSLVYSSTYYSFSSASDAVSMNGTPAIEQQVFPPGSPRPGDITRTFDYKNAEFADLNGDGNFDLLIPVTTTTPGCSSYNICYSNNSDTRIMELFVYLNNGSGTVFNYSANFKRYIAGASGSFNIEAGKKYRIVDFNSDGLMDIALFDNISWRYSLNDGRSFSTVGNLNNLTTSQYATNSVDIFDYNRDGYLDVVWHDKQNEQLKLRLWNFSTNSMGTTDTVIMSSRKQSSSYSVGDMTGDGFADLIEMKIDSGVDIGIYAGLGDSTRLDKIYKIIDGAFRVNRVTKINYGSLGNSSNYTNLAAVNQTSYTDNSYCSNWTYPVQCVPPSVYMLDSASFYTAVNRPFGVEFENENPAPVFEMPTTSYVVTDIETSAPTKVSPALTNKASYQYHQARYQAGGRGYLGFERITVTDQQTGIKTETLYHQNWPFIGSIKSIKQRTKEGNLLSEVSNVWIREKNATNQRINRIFLDKVTEKNYSFIANGASQGELLQTSETDNDYDVFGNVLKLISTSSGKDIAGAPISATRTIENIYGLPGVEDFNNLQGRLTKTTTKIQNASSTASKTVEFKYYDADTTSYDYGLLKQEIAGGITTEYQYDRFGNKKQTAVTALNSAGISETRISKTVYTNDGKYISYTENDLQQRATVVNRTEFGSPTSVDDANGVNSRIHYDAFGREYMKKESSGAWSRSDIRWCNATQWNGVACPAGAVSAVFYKISGGAQSREYKDMLGRVIRTSKLAFDGRWINVDIEYDRFGRVERKSTEYIGDPLAATTATAWTRYEYNILGQPTKITSPYTSGDNAEAEITYSGYSTTTTNALGQSKTETKNGLGQLVEVKDALLGLIKYEYDVHGGLLKATTRATHVDGQVKDISVRMCYDNLGRKTAMLDPDKGGVIAAASDLTIACSSVAYRRTGWWTYKYNSFGELQEQSDPKGQRTQMHYDKLGRMIGRVDVKANGSIESFTQWFYEKGVTAQSTGINGKLTAVVMNTAAGITQSQITTAVTSGTASCVEGSACFKTLYEFDGLTRPQNTKTYYPGSTTAYTSWIDYDPIIGRVLRQYDPLDQQLTENGNELASGTQTIYNDFGYVSSVRDIGSGQLISAVTEMNARGQVTKELRGNGATTQNTYDDLTGQLTNQQAGIGGVFSIQNISYKWDKIGNLQYRKNNSPFIGGSGNKNKQESFCYDILNRLTKTVAGVATTSPTCSSPDIVYDGFGNIKTKAGVAYQYGSNAGPHAATNVGGVTYTYDANGNAINGDGRTFDYTSYDMAAKISKSSTHYTEFKYGPDRARWYREDVKSGSATIKTTYIGNIEKIETGSDIEWKRYVGDAIFTYKTNSANQVQSKDKAWVYSDHLGSVDVITDNVGSIRHSMSFDPWGYRRDGENWSNWLQLSEPDRIAKINDLVTNKLKPTNMSRPITTRGYTGHEMVDDFGIIHMNGRIYDAKIARFLQADPFVDGATDTQGYNRYSYVRNNPLNATDPSGYFAWIPYVVSAVVAYGVSDYATRNDMPWLNQLVGIVGCMSGNTAICAGANFGSTYAQTGNLGMAIVSSVTAGATSGMDRVSAFFVNGAMSGTMSVMAGGSYEDGFISGALGSQMGSYGLIGGMIIGGTISELTGGKFANGAASAAFSYVVMWGASKIGAGGTSEDVVTTGEKQSKSGKVNPEDIARPEIDYKSGGYRTHGEAMEALELNMIDAIKDGNPDWEYGGIAVYKDGRYYISNIVTSHNKSAIFWSVPTLDKIAGVAQISGLHHYHPIHNGGVPRAFSDFDMNTFNGFRKDYGQDVKGLYLIDKHGTRKFDGTTDYKGISCVKGVVSC